MKEDLYSNLSDSEKFNLDNILEDKILEDELPIQQWAPIEIIKSCFTIILESIPVAFSLLLQNLFLTINLHYVGELNNLVFLDALGLGALTINCCGGMLIIGFNQGFGSMFGRAFGMKNEMLKQNYLNKAIFLLAIAFSLLVLFFLNVSKILIALGQHQEVSEKCEYYLIRITPGLGCFYLFDLLRNTLNAQNINKETLAFMFIGLFIHIIFCKLLVFSYGVQGIIFSMNFSNFLILAFVTIFIFRDEEQKKLFKIQNFLQIQTNFKIYFLQCLYITLPIFLDLFAFEILALFIGKLHNLQQLGAHIACSNFIGVSYSIPFGISGSLVYKSSASSGENNPIKTKNYYYLCFYISLITSFIIGSFIYIFIDQIAAFYTNDPQMIKYFKQVFYIYIGFILIDHNQVITSGIIKGIDLSEKLYKAYIFFYYFIGTPFSLLLGFLFKLEIIGFWIGFLLSIFSIFLYIQYLLTTVNWKQKINQVYQKTYQDHQDIQMVEIQ